MPLEKSFLHYIRNAVVMQNTSLLNVTSVTIILKVKKKSFLLNEIKLRLRVSLQSIHRPNLFIGKNKCQGYGSILIDNARCSGIETSLDQCRLYMGRQQYCTHSGDAGVIRGNKIGKYVTDSSISQRSISALSLRLYWINEGCVWDTSIVGHTLRMLVSSVEIKQVRGKYVIDSSISQRSISALTLRLYWVNVGCVQDTGFLHTLRMLVSSVETKLVNT